MHNTIIKFQSKSIIVVLAVILLTACGEYFDNPLIDKDTGEEINLFLIDSSYFQTKMTYNLLDSSDSNRINSDAVVQFSGKNATDIITFGGEKKQNFHAKNGTLNLTVDPGVSITSETPFVYSIHVEAEDYNTFTKEIQVPEKGEYTFDLVLSGK